MRAIASFDLKIARRITGFLVLGALGSMFLEFPLAGVLNYAAGLLYPLLIGWVGLGAVLAGGRYPRTARAYVFGNLGVLASTIIALAVPGVAAPLYLTLVLVGLVAGIAVGAPRRASSPPPP